MTTLFNHLRRRGLTKKKFAERLSNWDKTRLIDFIVESSDLMPREVEVADGNFAFHANYSLAGGMSPCGEIGCRLNEVNKLVRFAALYADVVHAHPPFIRQTAAANTKTAYLRSRICDDLTVLYRLEPLITAGRIKFLPQPTYCATHWRSAFKKTSVDRAEKVLMRELSANVKVSIEFREDISIVHYEGPEELVPHGRCMLLFDEKPNLKLGKRSDQWGLPNVIGDDRKNLLRQYSWPTLYDVFLQQLYGNGARASFLTDQERDVIALDAASTAGERTSKALRAAFVHELPFLDGIPIRKLLQLRDAEGEAFAVYRDALTRAISEQEGADVRRSRQLFRDVVEPELNRVDAAVRSATSSIKSKIKSDVFFGTGVVSIGLATGFLAPDVASLVAALGGLKYGLDLLHGVNDALKEPTIARNSDYYFLWKVRDLSN